jgi:hypothetical protein
MDSGKFLASLTKIGSQLVYWGQAPKPPWSASPRIGSKVLGKEERLLNQSRPRFRAIRCIAMTNWFLELFSRLRIIRGIR